MTTLHHRFSGVFPNWNLPSVFHSCLLQMDIRFRENTLQRKELRLYGHKDLRPKERAWMAAGINGVEKGHLTVATVINHID